MIGSRLTSFVAQIVMDLWAQQFTTRLTKAGVSLELFLNYMYNANQALKVIPRNLDWDDNWNLVYKEIPGSNQETEDDDVRTMSIIWRLADSITPGIRFTIDLP